MSDEKPRFLDGVRNQLRVRHYSLRTEEAYVAWIRRFILFHGKQHPAAMGAKEVNEFLTHLAVAQRVSASTQTQALSALPFLYDTILQQPLPQLDIVRAMKPRRLPVVLTRDEISRVLGRLDGVNWIVGTLLYGAGMRLLECLRLRVKDVDFEKALIMIWESKGNQDRRTMLPEVTSRPLREHLEQVRALHLEDLAAGQGAVYLPGALERKYPQAARQWGWQYVFPAAKISLDPRGGVMRRHHLGELVIQRAVRRATERAEVAKPVTPHTFRHSFAPALVRDALARAGPGHPDGAGAAGPPKREDDDDLHACAEPGGRARNCQPCGHAAENPKIRRRHIHRIRGVA